MAADPGAEEVVPRSLRKREGEVIDAAIKVFWRKGYAAASVQDVAEEVGVLKGSLYYYIDSKEDLLARIFTETNRQAMVIIAEISEFDGTPLERLRAYFERYVLWYLENVENVSLYFTEWRYLTGERRQTMLDQRRVFEHFVQELIDAARASGEVEAGRDTRVTSFFLLGAVNNVFTWYARDGALTSQEIAEAYTDLVVGSLRPR